MRLFCFIKNTRRVGVLSAFFMSARPIFLLYFACTRQKPSKIRRYICTHLCYNNVIINEDVYQLRKLDLKKLDDISSSFFIARDLLIIFFVYF